MGLTATPTQDDPPPQTEPGRRGTRPVPIGRLLRRTRQDLGIELSDAAADLRLRQSYIEAIEAGAYDRLPGATYAVGFVRAYAEYLGLDGAEAVRRFKREGRGLVPNRGLSFPMPLSERGIPGGRILMLAVVLAVCGYGVWYYLGGGGHHRHMAGAVPANLLNPPVPSAIAPSSDSTSMAATPPPPEGTAFNPPAEPNPTANAPPSLSSNPSPSAPVAASSGPQGATEILPAPSASQPPESQPAESSSADAAGASAAPARSPPSPSPSTMDAAAPPALRPARNAALTPPAIPTSPIPDAAPTTPTATGKAHIQVRAVGDVWMEVRDANNKILVSHVLRKGEIYHVPEETGLTLKTGRIEELAITVGGRKIALPRAGKVRTLALDPARLDAGTAILASPAAPEETPATSNSPAAGSE
jgi:cytoskeleton protein RodZ